MAKKHAEIYDYGLFDIKGLPTQTLINGQAFDVVMKIRFNKKKIENPIFCFYY